VQAQFALASIYDALRMDARTRVEQRHEVFGDNNDSLTVLLALELLVARTAGPTTNPNPPQP